MEAALDFDFSGLRHLTSVCNGPQPVNLAMIIAALERKPPTLEPLQLPSGIDVERALDRVLRLLSVGSKRFLTTKVDRSVTARYPHGRARLAVRERGRHPFRERLRPLLPEGRTMVTESGIHSRDDVARMQACGVSAFLVGEAFMRREDPGAGLRELFFDGEDT